MTKLLHEQLRDVKVRGCSTDWLLDLSNIPEDCDASDCNGCIKSHLNALADRIEREYILRPRYEDGEIVQFDDTVNDKLRGDVKVDRISFTRSGFYFGASHNAKRERIVEKIRYDYGEPVKRPAPPVLDADGVEIKVGDTVYSKHNGSPFTVEKVRTSDKYLCGKDSVCIGGGVFFPATDFTHENPVFDADGVRICKGDKVWHVNGSIPWNVVEINNGTVIIEDPLWSHDTEVFDAKNLTHQEPDTLEKLKADRLLMPSEYKDKYSLDKQTTPNAHMLGRAIALIERGME